MNKTKIEWVLNPDGTQGYTWNPITGCLNGCPYCYARKLANGRLKKRYLANENIAMYPNANWFRGSHEEQRRLLDPFYPRFWEDRLMQLDRHNIRKAIGVFVCDMSDLFGIGIPEDWTRRILNKIGQGGYEEHRFYLLTKQPQNLYKLSPFPDNCWVGVTVCNDKMLDVAVDKLEDIKAIHKFISCEPLLKRLTLSLDYTFYYSGVDWVIIGAQTKPAKFPRIEWVEEIVRACDKANIPVFLKDNLKPILPEEVPFYDVIDEDPMLTPTLRQEMPK